MGWGTAPGAPGGPSGGGPVVGWILPEEPRGPRLGVGSVVGRTFDVFGREWSLFIVLSVPVAIVLAGNVWVPAEDIVLGLLVTALSLLAGAFTSAGVAVVTRAVVRGEPIGLTAAIALGLPGAIRLLRLYALLLVVAAVIGGVVGLVLVTAGPGSAVFGLIALLLVIGALLAIVPLIRLAPVTALLVLERIGPLDAVRRTWRLTHGRTIAIFAIGMIVGLAAAPALWGAGLMAVDPGPIAAIANGLAALVTTAILTISATLIYLDLTADERAAADRTAEAQAVVDAAVGDVLESPTDGEPGVAAVTPIEPAAAHVAVPVAPEPVAPARGRRGLGLALVLGTGLVLSTIGISVFGDRLGEIGGIGSNPGVLVAGTAYESDDPCLPGDVATTFARGDEVWVGGYLAEPVPSDRVAEVELRRGAIVLEEWEAWSDSFLPLFCYWDGPFGDLEPGSYDIVVRYEGRVIGAGTFTITP